MSSDLLQIENLAVSPAPPLAVTADLRQRTGLLFVPDLQIQILPAQGGEPAVSCELSATRHLAWLPRGDYRVRCDLEGLQLSAGAYRLRLCALAEQARKRTELATSEISIHVGERDDDADVLSPQWSFEAGEGTSPVQELAWNHGHESWFFRHFDHAALVVTDYLLGQHPLLRGRILDIGCGDGIIDLGIFLRMQPEELVGIDPFEGFKRLPDALRDHHLPSDLLDDPRLQFRPDDANSVPYPDDYFDVVVSWGSLEHIAGGYAGALRETRRVLKPDGLFFVHPGLYYGALGNHLGEFFDDPFIHLKLPPEQLHAAVLNTKPRRMDRAGHVATPEEYWQWYTELNPIRVAEFERELRHLGFEPWRVALRSSDRIEYTPELQGHSMLDLATAEIYLSAWNRKPGRKSADS